MDHSIAAKAGKRSDLHWNPALLETLCDDITLCCESFLIIHAGGGGIQYKIYGKGRLFFLHLCIKDPVVMKKQSPPDLGCASWPLRPRIGSGTGETKIAF